MVEIVLSAMLCTSYLLKLARLALLLPRGDPATSKQFLRNIFATIFLLLSCSVETVLYTLGNLLDLLREVLHLHAFCTNFIFMYVFY